MKEESLWLKQAKEDLKTAQANLKLKIYYAAAFFAHQSAEKSFKAVCIRKFGELVKVHDLVFLAKKAGAPENLLGGCKFLNRVYIEARYPSELNSPSDLFSEQDASKCIEIASGVLKWSQN